MMPSLLHRFHKARVAVIGDVMLDEYIVGAVSRISPEAPVPVLAARARYASPGGAANVAINLKGLGAGVTLVGMAGRDPAGIKLRQLLRERSISCQALFCAGERGTISKTRIVAGQQQICRIDNEVVEEPTGTVLEQLIESAVGVVESCAVVVLSDYAKGVLSAPMCRAVIDRARRLNKVVIVDPKSRSFDKYAGCTVLTPNTAEASQASGFAIHSEFSLHQAGNALMEQLPGAAVLITRGPDGMALFHPGSKPVLIPSVARQLFDVVGAGDTAVATLAVALASGFSLQEAMVWSNIAAGIVVGKPGTASVSLQELLEHSETADLLNGLGRLDHRKGAMA
jgi:D-beta-D-heptose 7-phosphate kinase/D-beta-D-heptose 1-phosphate adenosyltransferase